MASVSYRDELAPELNVAAVELEDGGVVVGGAEEPPLEDTQITFLAFNIGGFGFCRACNVSNSGPARVLM
jgi:hypothetical protein